MSTYPSDQTLDARLDPTTSEALSSFGQRRKVLLCLRAIAIGIIVFVAAMFLIALCDYIWIVPDALRALLSLVGYAATFAAMWFAGFKGLRENDDKNLAVHMQSTAPRLRDDLLSAVELADPADANGSTEFRQRLQGRVARRVANLDVSELLPVTLIRRWLSTGLTVAAVCLILMLIPQMQFGRRFARAMLPGVPIERASKTQITILQPSPATGYVAQGDAVGIVVEIGGQKTDDVRLVWQTDDGVSGETMMSPRVKVADANSSDESVGFDGGNDRSSILQTSDTFAANLSVGTSPVEYQVLAGDAITLWNRLTPLPRPRVSLFTKQYVFPDYAQLSERVEEDEHGDLKALVGTTAQLSIEFDEPVQDAKIRYANEGGEINLSAADESQTVYTATIPIKTAAQYQVDAVSMKSGLNNPFSPSYTITPVVDLPPVARWDASVRDMMIVSPLAVLDLAGSVQDDLPVDQIVQEFAVNLNAKSQFAVATQAPSRDTQLRWQWDLMHREGADSQTPKLSAGDIVRTRLVAIDRQGQRGESRTIDLLIADDGFSDDRHQRLEELRLLAQDVLAWTTSATAIGDTLKTLGREPKDEGNREQIQSLRQAYAELNERTTKLVQSVAQAMEISDQVTEANTLEMLGRSVIALDGEINFSIEEISAALSIDDQRWESRRQKNAKAVSNDGTRASHQAGRIDTLARALISHQLSLSVARDAVALRNSLRPMLIQPAGGESAVIPADRFGRYVTVTLGRMQAIEELIEKHSPVIMDSTRAHFGGESWNRWAERWSVLLTRLEQDNQSEENRRKLISRFSDELKQKAATGFADGRLIQLFNESYRDIRREMRSYAALIEQVRRSGREKTRSATESQKTSDADKAALANFDADFHDTNYRNRIVQTTTRLTAESELHRRRPRVDLQHAADLSLLRRAIDNVNQDGFVPYRDEMAEDVHANLAGAIRVLESLHEIQLSQQELMQLLESEQSIADSPEVRLSSGIWIYRFPLAAEWSIKQWQEAKLDWAAIIEPIDRTRYDSDFSAARDRIARRRWDQKEPVSAEVALTKLTSRLETGLARVEPHAIAARQTLQRYVLTLAEQAREAAQEARDAQQRTDDRSDDQNETAEQLAKEQEDAESAAEQTVQALIDKANTSDILDDQQRDVARDADAAAAAIQDAVEKSQEAMQQATSAANEQQRKEALEKAETSLQELAESLEKTAEHFERLENGDNVDASREELRQAEEELRIAQDLEERYEKAEAMAEAAKSDPKELLKKLEEELKKNEPMQQELSEIAENAAETAQKTLEQAENDEREVNQSLERSDAAVQEAKRRTAKKLEELARRIDTIDKRMLQTAQDASGWANEPRTRDKLDEAKQTLRKAIDQTNQMGGENALVNEMKETTKAVGEAIDQATETIEEAIKEAVRASQEDVHKNRPAQQSAQKSMENKSRTMRNRVVQDMNRERSQWSREEQEAARRVQQAQRQERDARDQRQRAEDRLKKADPKKTDDKTREQLKDQIEQLKNREANADKAEKAAEQTRKFAQEQRKKSEEKTREVQREKQTPLDRPNPAAQLAEETAKQAKKALGELGEELDQIAKQLGEKPNVSAPQDQTKNLAERQERINSDVDNAAEQVARAARHEQRLGQKENAEKLEQAAESIAENGLQAGEQAQQALSQASKKPADSQQASEKISEAQKQIGEEAKRLAEMLQQQSDQPAQPSSDSSAQASPQADGESPSSESAQSAKQMAQTLDELDRAIAESDKQAEGQSQPEGQASDQAGDQGSSQPQSSQQQSSSESPGQDSPGEQSSNKQSPAKQTAGQASPTLSQMLDSQSQQAAKDRQQQLQPGKNSQASQQQGEAESGQKEGESLTQNSGPGDPPGGEGELGRFQASELGEWGSLRERKTDDATESRDSRVVPQYRREVEAYFRAVARRAAAKAKAGDKSQ